MELAIIMVSESARIRKTDVTCHVFYRMQNLDFKKRHKSTREIIQEKKGDQWEGRKGARAGSEEVNMTKVHFICT
jgi:hypothetical protein